MRPIDADALIAWLKKAGNYLKSLEDSKELTRVIGKIIDHVEAMPTIEQPTWISCGERLPPYNERVLANVFGRIEPLTLFYRDLLIEDYWEDDVGRVILLKAVTHWMPLPQPPKGDE